MLEKIQKHLYLVPYLFLIFVILDFSYQKNMIPENAYFAFSVCSAVILVFSAGLQRLLWRGWSESMTGILRAIFSFAALVYFLSDVGNVEIFPTPAFYYTLTVPLMIFTLINLFSELKENKQSATESEELSRLKQQNIELLIELEKLKSAVNSDDVLAQENYNPTEKETHLQIIYGLVEMLTKKPINSKRYLRGQGINKSAIASDLERDLQGIFINPRTAEGFRNKLTEILKKLEAE